MTMPKIRNAPPRAGMLIELLRGLGYSTATAIADIVDNSISADARRVDIHFEWAGSDSWVRISDDGLGMDDAGLEAAMQLGARDPRAVRDPGDLGRFGMGLKTASFSQARGLTVLSHQAGGSATCLRWDLDVLEGQGRADWPLIEGPAPGSENRLELPEGAKSGTVVLWEGLDRIVTEGFSADDMLELVDNVDAHLAMTFQRLIGAGPGQIDLRLNGRRVRPWDPFLTGHPGKALETPEYRLMGTPEVVVQCHVLPHKDRLSPEEYRNAAGPEGWTSQQGVYIYRNRRLLAVAGWMRLGERGRQWTRDEPHRLARIRLDIPNSADAEWGINVLKSTASLRCGCVRRSSGWCARPGKRRAASLPGGGGSSGMTTMAGRCPTSGRPSGNLRVKRSTGCREIMIWCARCWGVPGDCARISRHCCGWPRERCRCNEFGWIRPRARSHRRTRWMTA